MDMELVKFERLRDGLVCLTVFLFVKWLIGSKASKYRHPLPPSPSGLPLIGNLAMFHRDFREVFRELSEKFGSIFMVRLGPQKIVVISEIGVMKEAFVAQADAFSDRHIPPLLKYAIGSKGSFGFDNGPVWKARRRFGLSAMRTFGVGKHSMEQRIIDEGKMLCEAIENNQEVSFDPKDIITLSVSNIICSIGLGQRFDLNDQAFRKLISKFHTGLSSITLFSVGHIFPLLLHTPLYSDFRNLIFSIREMVSGVVDDHKQTLDDQHIRDIIDLYILEIRQQKKRGDEIVFDEAKVWRGVFDLFAAGTGTTSSTLLWGILIMATHPDAMKQVQDEIDCVVGDHRPPSMSDRELLPLTLATIMEIQRFRPVAALGLPRFTSTEAVVQGYTIPKGTAVLMNIWELMHSEKYWTEPERFNPHRFLSDDGKSIVRPDAFIPFGIGSRVCMGEILAKMELFLTFSSLLQRFTFRLPEDCPTANLDGIPGIAYIPHNFAIKAEKRG